MKLQCPRCRGFGVYKVKQRWWERVLHIERFYYCVDCEAHLPRSRMREVA